MNNKTTEKSYLANYNVHDFDVPLTSVDVVIFTVIDFTLNVLVTKRLDFPFKDEWATPGGFINLKKDHSLEDTAIRKLKEKTGYDAPYLEQMGTLGNAKRDPRGWSVTITYFALVNANDISLSNECRWCPLNSHGGTQESLAFDHNELIKEAYQRLKNKAQYSTVVLHVLPNTFTLSELQKSYEVILGGKLNKAGFRRRILKAEVIEEIAGESKQTATRKAQLYRKKAEHEVHFYMREIYAQ